MIGVYIVVALSALPEATRCYLEALMATGTYEHRSEFGRRCSLFG